MRPTRPPVLAVGRLAGSAAVFGGLVGRPLSVRRSLREGSISRVVDPSDRLPVGLPPAPHLTAWWRAATADRVDDTVPERGLPRAVSRSNGSRAGEGTGPTGFTRRLTNDELPIRRSPEVAAAGPMLGQRESRRAPRRPVQRTSEATEGTFRAHRCAGRRPARRCRRGACQSERTVPSPAPARARDLVRRGQRSNASDTASQRLAGRSTKSRAKG